MQGGDGQIQVLSHQLFIIEPGKRIFTDRIIFIENNKRLSLPELLAGALSAHGYGPRTAKGKTIYLLQHFGLAEISTLRDRKDWFEKLTPVRNCPVTPRPVKDKARFPGDNYSEIRLTVQDTMLHAAAGMGSLRALGSICSTRKIDIGDYIMRMNELLRNNRDLFIEYACTDTRVTLEYELRFQTSIEKLSNLVGALKAKPGITLGGSGVNLLESYIHAHEETGASFSTIFGLTQKATLETYSVKHGLQKKRMYFPAAWQAIQSLRCAIMGVPMLLIPIAAQNAVEMRSSLTLTLNPPTRPHTPYSLRSTTSVTPEPCTQSTIL